MSFNIKNILHSARKVFVCFVCISGKNNEVFPIQHKLIGFYNPDEKCLQRGTDWVFKYSGLRFGFRRANLLKPAGYVTHNQFNIQQLYALPTLYLCVLYLSENKQRLVPLTA